MWSRKRQRDIPSGRGIDRKFVESIPDGEYYAEGYLDNDNCDLEHHVKVCAKVIVQGDEMTVSLPIQSRDQGRGQLRFCPDDRSRLSRIHELSYPEGPGSAAAISAI